MILAFPMPSNPAQWAVLLKQAMYLTLRYNDLISEADFLARISVIQINARFAANSDKRVMVVFDILPPTSNSPGSSRELLGELMLQVRNPTSKARRNEILKLIVDLYQIDESGNPVETPLNSQSSVQPAAYLVSLLMAALLAWLKL
jgi:hypothetical protein